MSFQPGPPADQLPVSDLFDKVGMWLLLLFFTVMGAGLCAAFWRWILDVRVCS